MTDTGDPGPVDRAESPPRRVTLLGASGRVGAQALAAAQRAGIEVTVVTRRPSTSIDGVRVVVGAIDDRAVLEDALTGSDAVIAALGPRHNRPDDATALAAGMQALTAAMGSAGVGRLIALSGAGIQVAGDQKPLIDRLVSRFVRLAAKHVVDAKQREFEIFRSTDLDWTALRPAIVLDGPARGYRLSERLTPGARTTRADVGQALVDQLDDRSFIRAAPFVLPVA